MIRYLHAAIDFSIRHTIAVLVTVGALCIMGYWCLATMNLDAVPDLGDTQVIIYSRWDRSPDILESQVTYPIVSALLGAPRVKTVRGLSDFGYSFVYVIFDENTDLYWARSRVMEYLSSVQARLPEGVKTEIGPDATSLGWIFQYALVDPSGTHSLTELRSYQDWYLRNYLKSVRGVADVAAIGGFKRQYQVNVDAARLRSYDIGIDEVASAVRQGNVETSGRVLESGGNEYMVRGRGYANSVEDFGNIALPRGGTDAPVRISDLGEVVTGTEPRRGIADLDGVGDAVSGIVIMRSGENPLEVIDRVKSKLNEVQATLPAGVKIVPIYDRSELIHRTIRNVRLTILQVVLTVVLIILIFLWPSPTALIPLLTMPAAILISFIPLRLLGISVNVMSLAGIAIAFGELIDGSIIVVEQSHKRLEQWQADGSHGRQRDIVLGAVKEVAGPIVFSLLMIAVSVLPIFALEAQEGRMFRPLAFAKCAAMIVAAMLALTLDPALRLLFATMKRTDFRPAWVCGRVNALLLSRVRSEDRHPITGPLMALYTPVVRWTLQHKRIVLGCAAVLVAVTVPVALSLGSEFMPPMDEGTILYMPSTMPGVSVSQAQTLLRSTDSILKQFPEVDRVLGKAGRAETPTDPAPLSMLETLITLKPRDQWRRVPTWYSRWAPGWAVVFLRHITSDVLSPEELIREMNVAVRAPGLSNAWTMPIKGRVDMLSNGIRTPVGLKIAGRDAKVLQQIGNDVRAALLTVRGTRSVFAEQSDSGYYIDIRWRRDQLARYGISMEQAQQVVNSAIGGDNVTEVIAGPERYPVSVRYQRDFRDSPEALGQVFVKTGPQRQTPLSELADVAITTGPSMLRDENGMLTAYIYVDLDGRDAGTYVHEAASVVRQRVSSTAGYTVSWSGQFESMQRVNQRLKSVVPLTLAFVMLLIYFSTGSFAKTLIVLAAVPFSGIGAVWLLYLLHYNLSVAVWVGLMGLLSIDAETGIFMLLYLDLSCADAQRAGRLTSMTERHDAIVNGAAKRLRPKLMTFATTCIALLPVMWSIGTGADVMKRIAAPMVGGIFTSFLLELLVYPILFDLWKSRSSDWTEDHTRITSEAHRNALAFSASGD